MPGTSSNPTFARPKWDPTHWDTTKTGKLAQRVESRCFFASPTKKAREMKQLHGELLAEKKDEFAATWRRESEYQIVCMHVNI